MANFRLIQDEIYKEHITGIGHPECPERFTAISSGLSNLSIDVLKPRKADLSEILLCHTQEYYRLVEQEVEACQHLSQLSTGDVNICPKSLEVALYSVGGALTAVEALLTGEANRAFCNLRPPGHHATSDMGMGFCLFNNVAIAARYAQLKYRIEKIAIIDWDVHHGNGTQDIFYADPSVFYFSTHQSPLYPGTGTEEETGIGDGMGTTLNCPIRSGERARSDIMRAFKEKLIPAMEVFMPEFVIISAGFDAHHLDPIGGLNLTDDDFVTLTNLVKDRIANQYSGGKILSVLEGGYNLSALASAVKAHVIALITS